MTYGHLANKFVKKVFKYKGHFFAPIPCHTVHCALDLVLVIKKVLHLNKQFTDSDKIQISKWAPFVSRNNDVFDNLVKKVSYDPQEGNSMWNHWEKKLVFFWPFLAILTHYRMKLGIWNIPVDYLCCQSAPFGQSSMNPCSHSMSQSLDLVGPMYQRINCVSI